MIFSSMMLFSGTNHHIEYSFRYEEYKGVPNMSHIIWLRQNDPIETDLSETRNPPLTLIWLRHPNKFSSLIFILTQSQVSNLKMQGHIFSGVSVISV